MTREQEVKTALGIKEYLYFRIKESTFLYRIDVETSEIYWLCKDTTWIYTTALSAFTKDLYHD